MTSKPKFGIKGLTSVTARTTQKMKEKVGRADETVDVGFNQEHTKFDHFYRQLRKLAKDLTDYTKTLRAISDAHSAMGANTAMFYDSGSALYECNQRYILTVGDIDKARQNLDETLRVDIVAPVDVYLGQYKLIENRINERSRRRLEMDRFRHKVRKYQAHPPEKPDKLTNAEANYNMWKAAYDELNSELILDIQRLCADRNTFFDPCYSTLIQASARYYQEVAAITSSLVPMVHHLNGKDAHATRLVILDNDNTCALRTYEQHKKAGSTPFVPSYQQVPSYAQPQSAGYGAPAYGQQPPQQQGLAPPQYGAAPSQGFGAPQQVSRGPPPMPGRPMPAPPARDQARALYAFSPESPTELGFQPGQVISIISKNGDWWEAEVNGRRGLIPANYVQLM